MPAAFRPAGFIAACVIVAGYDQTFHAAKRLGEGEMPECADEALHHLFVVKLELSIAPKPRCW